MLRKGFPQGNEAVKEVSPTGRLYLTAKRLEIKSPGRRSCLAGLGTLNIASRPARRLSYPTVRQRLEASQTPDHVEVFLPRYPLHAVGAKANSLVQPFGSRMVYLDK